MAAERPEQLEALAGLEGKPAAKPKRKPPPPRDVLAAMQALHAAGMSWVGLKLLTQKLNYYMSHKRMQKLIDSGEVESHPALYAYRLKEQP